MKHRQSPIDKTDQSVEDPVDQELHNVRGLLHGLIKDLEKKYHSRQPISGISTGYSRLDELTLGFESGQFIVVAARPSMGKTSFALNICANLALGAGIPVLIISCAQSGMNIIQNLLISEARIDSLSYRNGCLESRDWINIAKSASRLAESPITVTALRAPTIEQIRLAVSGWRNNERIFSGLKPCQPGLVMIDYFSMIHAQGLQNGEKAGMAIARALKELAVETATTIVVTAGLSSWVDKHKTGRRPTLSDFTDHEETLADTADLVIFLHRDDANNQLNGGTELAEVILAKQRHGPTAIFQLGFLRKCGRFENLSESQT